MNEMPIEPRKPDTKFREAEAGHKKILQSRSRSRIHQKQHLRKPKPRPKPATFECLETEAGLEAGIFARSPASGSRSRPPTQPWCTFWCIIFGIIFCIIFAFYMHHMGQKSGPKTQKLDKSGILPVFNSFWPKKGVRCFSIWISRPDLEFSHNLTILGPHLLLFSHFKFLALPR